MRVVPFPVWTGAARYWGMVFVPDDADTYELRSLGVLFTLKRRPEFYKTGRLLLPLLLLGVRPESLKAVFRLLLSNKAAAKEWLVKSVHSDAFTAAETYQDWIDRYDSWGVDELEYFKLRHLPPPPATIAVLLFNDAASSSKSAAATRRSLKNQFYGAPPFREIVQPIVAGCLMDDLQGDYIAILQTGEILPKHALKLAAVELERLGRPDIAYSDIDEISSGGARQNPEFRPEPNTALMMSGTLCRGVWFISRETLLAFPGPLPPDAELLKLRLWFWYCLTAADRKARRIPYILTHRRTDAPKAPWSIKAAIVDRYLTELGSTLRSRQHDPIRLAPVAAGETPKVSLLIPSTLQATHSLRCISDIIENTRYAVFETIIGVSRPAALNTVQEAAKTKLLRLPNTQVHEITSEKFNYSSVNNDLAAQAGGDFLCLVNDDVSVINPHWLAHMVGHMADPRVGIIGAKLFYPDDTIQHGGVLMGLAGLCEHINRHLPKSETGYMSSAIADQELSAVTGACLLVRREIFDAVRGLDESYPSAFNDIDFCLRVREQGFSVVFAAGAMLYHHELQTYGSHYRENPAQEDVDAARMRKRWQEIIAEDPFHSPNLSLAPLSEGKLAFPPRL